jgi:hypothetical protein
MWGQKDALLEVPAEGRFDHLVALKGDKEIGAKIIGKFPDANAADGPVSTALGCCSHESDQERVPHSLNKSHGDLAQSDGSAIYRTRKSAK